MRAGTRMRALLGSYRWDWQELRGELPALAAAWLPCDPGDLIGPVLPGACGQRRLPGVEEGCHSS